jgi:hypothetical protein
MGSTVEQVNRLRQIQMRRNHQLSRKEIYYLKTKGGEES